MPIIFAQALMFLPATATQIPALAEFFNGLSDFIGGVTIFYSF